ncbi:hypothetical protein [Arthrobacter sp. 9V]|nr:hypothetical protein [Arthrobacter sp. 9V]
MKTCPFTPKEQELVNRAAASIKQAGYPPLSSTQAQVIRRTFGRLVTT